MDIIEKVILGAVQGLTEFLPVSSTGHLAITPWLLSWKDPGLPFDVALHLGSLIAIIYYFWKDLVLIIKEFFSGVSRGTFKNLPNGRIGLFIIIATIPAAVVGFLFEQYASSELRNPLLIAFSLSSFGVLLFVADRSSNNSKSLDKMSLIDCIIIGVSQCFAIIPGASRSGVTITGALFIGYKRDESAIFSFLLAAPIIAGACIFEARHLELSEVLGTPFVLGMVTSTIFSFLSIKYLLAFIRRQRYTVFVVYRIALALVLVLLYFMRNN